jgi:hypothetical protein
MISAKTIQQNFIKILILLITVALSASAENELKVVRTSPISFDILFANSDAVTGVQFSVHASTAIVLESVKPGTRTADPSWIVGSYAADDSTLNIVILNLNQESFSLTSGTLASVFFKVVSPEETSSIILKNVMGIEKNGDSIGMTITNLVWNEKSSFVAKTDEMKPFILGQNFPNPFNPSTVLTYRLNVAAQVRLSIYDITGREVTLLIDQYQYAGEYHVQWDSNSNNGQKLASGMYVARLTVDKNSVSRKMLLTK